MLPSKKLALLDLLASKPSNPVSNANTGRVPNLINFAIVRQVCALLGHVRPCTLLSSFAHFPALARF